MWGGWGYTSHYNDTTVWVYDYNKNSWEERQTDNAPTSRGFHNMTYDLKSDRTILYGGYTGSAPGGTFHYDTNNSLQTWAYDYNLNTWTLLEPAINPGSLSFVGLVYVPSIDRTFLLGGRIDVDKTSDKLWLYDFSANTWTEVPPQP